MWFYVVREDGQVWINAVKKRKSPEWVRKLPEPFRGSVRVTENGIVDLIHHDRFAHLRAGKEGK